MPAISNDTQLFFLGTLYRVNLKTVLTSPRITLNGRQMEVCLCNNIQPMPAPFLRRWYAANAASYLKQRTHHWQHQMNLRANKITIREQKTRWGSCSSLGNIAYNWRIIMAPPDVIDYLVIHELAHLAHMNHSAVFWHTVSRYAPEYKKCRLWLKEHAGTLLNSL